MSTWPAPAANRLLVREWLDYAALRAPQMQIEKMKLEQNRGRAFAFIDGEERIADSSDRSVQGPRVYYRRELRHKSLVIAAKPQ